MQAVAGWTIKYEGDDADFYASGLSASLPNAQCTDIRENMDAWGGDMRTDDEHEDTVVAAATPEECCNFCKAFIGCEAW